MQAGGTGRVGGWEGDNVWRSVCECVSNESFGYYTWVKLITNCMLLVVNNARAFEVVDSRTYDLQHNASEPTSMVFVIVGPGHCGSCA